MNSNHPHLTDTPEPPAAVPHVPLSTLARVFATPERIRILGELAKGEALMTKERAARFLFPALRTASDWAPSP